RQQGRVSALFLMGYAICRLIAESFRQPDSQLGFVAFGWLTMGQVLSIPMLLIGIWLWWAKR
ncbi:prolipoprotein diacylglyceryl transferase family protein, partial [Acinetobacter baumannii]